MILRVINQYEKGVMFGFGRYLGLWEPGLHIFVPVYHRLVRVDTRIKAVDIPKQEIMTKDNVPIMINAVIYFRVKDPEKAILNVEDYHYAVSKYGQTSLRNVTGEISLDALLSERQDIAEKLRMIVDKATDPWGIDVTAIELQDIELPENMKRVMARQAEAEREKRGVIIKAKGEVMASDNLRKAAMTLSKTPGALHLRTLHTINDLSSDKSETIVYALPVELLRLIERAGDLLEKKMHKGGGK